MLQMPAKTQSLPTKVPKHANGRLNWHFSEMIRKSYIGIYLKIGGKTRYLIGGYMFFIFL